MKQRISGFTMCPDSIVAARGLVCAAVFGKVARYEEMAEGACTASHARIAADLNISVRAVGEHLRWLTQEGYIQIVKKQSGGTNHYATTDKVQVVIGASEEPRQELPSPPQPRQDVPTPSAGFAEPPRQNLPTKILIKKESKIKSAGEKPAPPETPPENFPKTKNPTYGHPALAAYRQIAGRHVQRAWQQDVADAVAEDPETIARWSALVKQWVGRNYNPGNIEGLLDAWRNGGIRKRQSGETAEQRFERRVRDLG